MHPTPPRFARRALPALVAAVLLAGCTGTGSEDSTGAAGGSGGNVDPGLRHFYGQRIGWAACPDEPRTTDGRRSPVQCATVKVPLDYAHPAGDVLEVAVVRYPAARRDQRIGSLVVNPGGPGSSGVAMIERDPAAFDGPLHDRFDIIGFDPRGVGGTAPVKCLDDQAHDTEVTTDRPAADHARVLADACQAKYGKVLPHVGTRSTARDMDVLRGALGDSKLSYLGLSYGTYLGSLYAEQFPDRVGRLVLDGAIPSSASMIESTLARQEVLERAFTSFATDCTTQVSCPLGTDPGRAAQKLADYLDNLADHPLRTSHGRTLTANAAWTAVLAELAGGSQSWAELREPLDWAMLHGRGDELLAVADTANGRDDQGRYSVSTDAATAISCADSAANSPTPEQLRALLADLAAKAPLVSRHAPETAALDPDCRPWPFRTVEQPHAIRSPGNATPVLVVGSTADPVTPYAGAQRLTAELGNAVLLTRDGDGHTAYALSSCIRAAVQAFLTEGTAPAAGKHCASI